MFVWHVMIKGKKLKEKTQALEVLIVLALAPNWCLKNA